MLSGYHGQFKKKKKKRLLWFLARVWTFRSPRTLGYLRLCCPSFALCSPYKYSSRIKGSPLASWPVTRLSLLVPAESVRARRRGRGNTRHLSDWTIFRKFETMTWQDTPRVYFKRGPLFVCQKCVRVMEGEIMALRGFEERSQSMDSAILKEETVQFQFSNKFSWGTSCVSEAFTCEIYFFPLGVNPPNKTGLLNTKSKISTIFSRPLMLKLLFLVHFKGKN